MRDLSADTRPTRTGPSTYRTTVPAEWNFRHPSGGVLMTAALRAAAAELDDPGLVLRSASTLFSSVIDAGDVDCSVHVIRRGGVAAQVRVSLTQGDNGEPGLDVVATFARARDGMPEFVDVEPPRVPRPEESPPFEAPTPIGAGFKPPIFANLDVRLALGPDFWKPGFEPGPARLARWMRYRVPQRLASGAVDPMCYPPVVDTMPPSAVPKLGPGFKPFVAPSLDLTVHFFEPAETDWLLVDTHTRWAGHGYGSADTHVWSEGGRLLAYGTQMWIFRKVPDGISPG